ncbi:unnamed protein product [Brugia pahangi]|uniref:Uncharacterized protein n=1 Tax=Brugia pahangi TaxID=6280 RepID=A0A0N4TL75_BRUPA|nr:unnamed protein product [Brugia pahangi]
MVSSIDDEEKEKEEEEEQVKGWVNDNNDNIEPPAGQMSGTA